MNLYSTTGAINQKAGLHGIENRNALNQHCVMKKLLQSYFSATEVGLQCFDTVGWVAGRASGL